MLISNNKKNLITNSLIEIDEAEGNGKGHYFKSRFIEAGVAHYDELGDILITKETLTKFIDSMVGCPVIINHKDVTDKNVDKLRVGVISRVWYEPQDGWFYCEGVITDEQAVDLIKNQRWNVSCSYNFVSDNTPRIHNGKKIDMEFTDGEFLHLAIVENPRYEGANIVVNSADKKWSVEESDEEGFVTIKYGEKSWKVPISKLEESNKGFESYIDKIISNITKEKFDIEKFDKSGYKYKIRMTEDQYNSKIMDKVRDAFINTNKLAKTPYYENYAGDKCMILEFENKNVNNEDDIQWITVKGNHIPIKKGQSKDEAVKEFLEGKQSGTKDKSKDSEKKNGDFKIGDKVRLKEYPDKEYTISGYKNGKYLIGKYADYHADEMIHSFEGIDDIKPKKYHSWDMKDSFTRIKENDKLKKDNIYVYDDDLNYGDVKDTAFTDEEINKLKKIGYINQKNEIEIPSFSEMIYKGKDSFEIAGIDFDLYYDKTRMFEKKQSNTKDKSIDNEANNNIGDITMTVLNDLKDFIMNVVSNEKDEEMKEVKNEDKRKLIDEVGGILKGKVDEEIWRTVIGKLEKIAYKSSEDDKADNEIVEEEDKKVTENEDEEKEEKFEEEKEIANKKAKNEDKEDKADNKCGKAKNSIEETRNILFGGIVKQELDYKTQEERLELGNNY